MALITDIGSVIEDELKEYAQLIFEGVADPIRTALLAIGLVTLLFIAVNSLVQFRAINYSEYLKWGLRYFLIYSFATIWANFEGIYDMLIEIPDDYSGLMLKAVALDIRTLRTDVLDPGKITGDHPTYAAMDEFAHAIVWIAADFLRDTSITDIGMSLRNVFTGVLILIIGGIFTAASAIIVLIGRVGFILSISLAPLAILMLMAEQTRGYFESWTRFVIGFTVIPLLTAALMAIVLYLAGGILAESNASSLHKTLYFGFIFVMIAALVLLFMIPTMASALAASSVAAVGAGAAFAATSMVKNNTMRTLAKTRSVGQRVRGGADAAGRARSAGASPGGIARSAVNAMRQSAALRSQRRDERLGKNVKGNEGNSSSARRRYAGAESAGGSSGGHRSGRSADTPEQQNLNRS